MSGDSFIVRFVRHKTCFLYMPGRWTKKMQELRKSPADSFVKILYSNKTAYFGWQQSTTSEPDCLGINATFATNLGLKEGDSVSVITYDHPSVLRSVTVSPSTSDDLEMIESSSGIVQSTLLDQIRIVYNGQKFTAWISNTLPISLKIVGLEPNVPVGRLEQMTEVAVGSPENFEVPQDPPPSSNNNSNVISNCILPGVPRRKALDQKFSGMNFLGMNQPVFRILPLNIDSPLFGPCDVFMKDCERHQLSLLQESNCKSSDIQVIICKMSKLKLVQSAVSEKAMKSNHSTFDLEPEHDVNITSEEKSMYIRLKSIDELSKENNGEVAMFQSMCVYVSNNLRRMLDLEIGCRVKLTDFNMNPREVVWKGLELIPFYNVDFRNYEECMMSYVKRASDGLLLSRNMLLTLPSSEGFIDVKVRLQPTSCKFVVVSPTMLDRNKINLKAKDTHGINEDAFTVVKKQLFADDTAETLNQIHLQDIITRTLKSLKTTLGLRQSVFTTHMCLHKQCNILLCGKRGSGKSSTGNALCHTLHKAPYYVYFASVKCRSLRGKKVETIMKAMQNVLSDCVYYQPSIILLDDLETIAGHAGDQDQNNSRGAYFNRVGQALTRLLAQVQKHHSVAIIATAPHTSSLCSSLIAPRGIHFFSSFIELPELTLENRQGILNKLVARKLAMKELESVKCFEDLPGCAVKTEGYSCQDLADLIDKAVFAACKRQGNSVTNIDLESSDVQEAVSLSVPMLLRGVDLHKESSFLWDDIGGLTNVKDVLKEVLQWPALYPSLFRTSPLRHQSGLLLYGAPGTGKTMLAGAVANECGLNFISVKGPELLSKYIGASEESVRNVFQKAQSAKPCVVFFDEFDSLAPRRGHDSTGVTDRVVNQLLTQLDGVESLSGVWVLAATSRPDLLDPALLRPGRLDRSVLCPLPTKEDRLEILQALSRKLTIDSTIDLTCIAADTSGFTGADLQSILYTAQLNAVEESQLSLREDFGEHELITMVRQKHLDDATKATRPSLSSQERLKYSRIYEKFTSVEIAETSSMSSQRATLA